MICFTTTLMPATKLTKDGIIFAPDCLKNLAEKMKGKDLMLEQNVGRLYNVRLEEGNLIADCEIYGGIAGVIKPDVPPILLPDKKASISSVCLSSAKLIIVPKELDKPIKYCECPEPMVAEADKPTFHHCYKCNRPISPEKLPEIQKKYNDEKTA